MKSGITALALATLVSASPLINIKLGSGSENEMVMGVPFTFTSTYAVRATPDQVVNSDNEFTGGLEGASGWFLYGINSHDNVICYNITIENFRGDYESAANTATHIHEGAVGMSGPPRIAFPNPEGGDGHRTSIGCITGPFETGVVRDGKDTGEGFHVSQIEANPAAFFTDVHSSEAVPGAVRGQLGGAGQGC